ncbi:MAG: hypothetical protein J5733_11600 [Bacteroidaceae bacterium]|nr:hypothetical protein [Bacteroidaceae bacterium]
MKRFVLYIIILYSVLLLAGCRDYPLVPEGIPMPRTEAERTVIVYLVGDNTLSSQVKLDTIEMARGKSMIPENVNYIIYLDDKQGKPGIYELSKEKGMQLWKRFDEELCSTDSLTMLRTLQVIEHYFPARHYGIVFWSHASGWVPEQKSTRRNTFGKDETPKTGQLEMEIPVLRDVLSQLPKFDYIFFDACFMQCIEVAYDLRDVTGYMIGSPAEIPGPGAPYDKIMEALCTGNARGIVNGYDSGYPGTYNYFYYPGVLLSCIDCTQLEALAQATGQFLIPFYMNRNEPLSKEFQSYCDISYEKFTYCFDMRTTMCRLLSPDDYAAWMECFDKAVPLHTLSSTNKWFAFHCNDLNSIVKDPECYGGVSMFVPMEKYATCGWNEDFRKTSWYKATGWAQTGW